MNIKQTKLAKIASYWSIINRASSSSSFSSSSALNLPSTISDIGGRPQLSHTGGTVNNGGTEAGGIEDESEGEASKSSQVYVYFCVCLCLCL